MRININTQSFKSLTPFYYPKGKNVDRAEILAREAEWRQIIEEDVEPSQETLDTHYGEQLSDEELDEKLRELDYARGRLQISSFVPEASEEDSEDDTPKRVMPVFQTEDTLPKEKRKLDIRG